jgi:DNA-binding CsgD family transcriptional regulator
VLRGLIDIVQAVYSTAPDDRQWLELLADAAHPVLEQGLGLSVFTFDASGSQGVQIGLQAARGLPPDFDPAQTAESTPAEFVPRLFESSPPALLLSECVDRTVLDHGFVGQTHGRFGIRDVIAIRGGDPCRRGCLIAVALPELRPLPARRRTMLARVAAHLAAGWRLRQSLAGGADRAGTDGADAVFDERGRLQHLDPGLDARRDRTTLSASIERFRQARQLDDEAALEVWRALVDGRWSIVQRADTDGKRFLLARKNAPEVRDRAALTRREALVSAYAALGHANKLIAYELGIPESSVSVLLKRAMQKLGTKSRTELAMLHGSRGEAAR